MGISNMQAGQHTATTAEIIGCRTCAAAMAQLPRSPFAAEHRTVSASHPPDDTSSDSHLIAAPTAAIPAVVPRLPNHS